MIDVDEVDFLLFPVEDLDVEGGRGKSVVVKKGHKIDIERFFFREEGFFMFTDLVVDIIDDEMGIFLEFFPRSQADAAKGSEDFDGLTFFGGEAEIG